MLRLGQVKTSPFLIYGWIHACQRLGVCTILDPSPAEAKLPRVMMGVDVLTPNQLEAETLLGLDPVPQTGARRKVQDPKQIGMDLLARGLVAFFGSMGWIGGLPDEERLTLLAQVKSRLTASSYRLPFETHVHWTRLADPRNEPY